MKPFQKMKDKQNREIVLFPFEYLYMSQDEGGDYSHQNTYNLDFIGWGENGRILKCPFYAPVTLKCVAIWDATSNNRVYESTQKVHFADGTIDYLTISFAHDDTPTHGIGDVIPQGQLLGHTGTAGNVTGDHTHTCCGKGRYEGYTQRQGGHYDLTNRCHYWDATFVNDTIIVEGYNHNWLTYGGKIGTEKSKFKWVLYAKNLRNKR
jgi:hypothetical protein